MYQNWMDAKILLAYPLYFASANRIIHIIGLITCPRHVFVPHPPHENVAMSLPALAADVLEDIPYEARADSN